MQAAAPSPRSTSGGQAASATPSTSVHHVVTVDSVFLASHPSLAPYANTSLPPPLLASLPASCFRVYSRFHVKSVLALMGVKPRHIHRLVAHTLTQLSHVLPPPSSHSSASSFTVPLLAGETSFSHMSTVCLSSAAWLSLIRSSLTLSKHYTPSDTPALFSICHSIFSRQQHVLILLAGTSGSGKSTLASLLADRMRLSCVIGTDSVRHMLRQRVTAEACRVLHVSTYQAHQCVADDADTGVLSAPYSQPPIGQRASHLSSYSSSSPSASSMSASASPLSQAQKVRLGHHQQSLLVCAHLHSLLASLVASRTSAIIEGAHLLPSFLSYLLSSLSSARTLVLPFLIHISNETKHRERFALRSHPSAVNPYILHFPAIRTIQKAVMAQADAMGASAWLPSIDNTNMDRSVAAAHDIVSRIMVREGSAGGGAGGGGEWSGEGRAEVLREVDEMRAGAWSSKAMQRVIRMKVEKRHLFDRLREAEWKRREDDDGNEGEVEEDTAAEGPPVTTVHWNAPVEQPDASTFDSSLHSSLDHNQPLSIVSYTSTLPPPSLSSDTSTGLSIVPDRPLTGTGATSLSTTDLQPAHILSSQTPPQPSSPISIRQPLPVSNSPRQSASPQSPSSVPSHKRSPSLSSLPPPFLQHLHRRTARPASSDDDEYELKRRPSVVSESEHSVSVTYSHDVPSLLAPSADEGDGEADGSDDDDEARVAIEAIPESDGAEAGGGADSDSGSESGYERAATDDEEGLVAAGQNTAGGAGGVCSAGGRVVGVVDGSSLAGLDAVRNGHSSDSGSSRRREIVMY